MMRNSLVLLPFLASLAVTVLLIPLIIRISRKKSWYDTVDQRKIHNGQISRLGGAAIFWGSLAGWTVSFFFSGLSFSAELLFRLAVLLTALLGIHLIGLYDDFTDLRPRNKLFFQILAALGVMTGGMRFHGLATFFTGRVIDFPVLSWAVTLVWIVGVCNAVNLIDGMDGLASMISFISAMAMTVVALLLGRLAASFMALAIAGAVLGFFLFNSPPARLFMGDSGSLFLGMSLALLPLVQVSKVDPLSLPYSITILLIPITDTLFALARRVYRRKPISVPDREHLHHMLLDLGLPVPVILLLVGFYSLILASLPILSLVTGKSWPVRLMPILWVFTFFLFYGIRKLWKRRRRREAQKASETGTAGQPEAGSR